MYQWSLSLRTPIALKLPYRKDVRVSPVLTYSLDENGGRNFSEYGIKNSFSGTGYEEISKTRHADTRTEPHKVFHKPHYCLKDTHSKCRWSESHHRHNSDKAGREAWHQEHNTLIY
ncbi:hypothetical protein E2C01_000138 [Portunus trituberculatus]|uniref:Uncharacterized protein n=1 Tax=Portunus trituberculatus TaxID=210409 RepID=A0A5B7CFP8_PORTR|nr:hypothetical protein [Portunus trituberculatus]